MTASSNGWPGQTKAAKGCPGGADQRLLEHDPFVAGKDWLAGPEQPVAVPDQGRNVRHLGHVAEPPSCRNASRKNDSM